MLGSLSELKLLCFFAVGGPLPLPAKPLSDCRAVKQSPIATGNAGSQVPVYSAHAATLQRLVITICSGLYILTRPNLLSPSFPSSLPSLHSSSSIYRIHIFSSSLPPSRSPSFPPSLASSFLSSKQSLFKLSFAPRACQILRSQTLLKEVSRA